MSSEEQPREKPAETEIPDDAIEIAQVQYAWLWSSWWLLAIIVVMTLLVPILDPIIASAFLIIIVLPKFWQWRRTRYYLAEDTLIYQRGGLLQTSRYPITISRLTDCRSRHGIFGRTLGFQHVEIILENGALATLQYVPADIDVVDYLKQRMTPREDDAEGENASDEDPALDSDGDAGRENKPGPASE